VKRNPRFAQFDMTKDLRSGDLVLSRGNAYTSAAISQLGEFDTQFSHLSIVHVDDKGRTWTVEAHIEVGSFVRPLKDHIEDENRRIAVFRHPDEALAKKAAAYIFERVRKASQGRTGNIHYDFGFDMSEDKKLFCSEVISHAFDVASEGAVKMPFIKSKLMTRKPTFVEKLGIKVDESFVPADLEVDPRFELVAEWRDAKRMVDTFEKDALLQSVFDWNDRLGYEMQQASSMTSLIYRNVVWPMRRIPILKNYFKEDLPIYMSRSLIGYFGVIDTMGKLLQGKLAVENKLAIEKRGVPLTGAESRVVLEAYRVRELKLKKQPLHFMYHPLRKE
jgi:hypothetical protein